jgi:Ca-activated chloride channel family protein
MKKIFYLLPIMVLCSCAKIPGTLLVMGGNFFASREKYDEASSLYAKALEYQTASPYAEYGLGAVYTSLDEGKLAMERYDAVEKILETLPRSDHRELRFRTPYNTGVLLFGERDFAGAAVAFRKALEIDGSRIEAKRNLELSLLSLAHEKTSAAQSEKDQEPGTARKALFEYLRKHEQNQWRSREWAEDPPEVGPDY